MTERENKCNFRFRSDCTSFGYLGYFTSLTMAGLSICKFNKLSTKLIKDQKCEDIIIAPKNDKSKTIDKNSIQSRMKTTATESTCC